jgi:hypothetical protein
MRTAGRILIVRQFQHLSDMDESNEFFRATVLANKTVGRLQQEGHPAGKAKRLVAQLINAEETAMLKHRRSFDEAWFVGRLHQLPDMPGSNS